MNLFFFYMHDDAGFLLVVYFTQSMFDQFHPNCFAPTQLRRVPCPLLLLMLPQAANAKLLEALSARMVDVGASRSVRIPSLQPGGGENTLPSSAILQTLSTQLEVKFPIL